MLGDSLLALARLTQAHPSAGLVLCILICLPLWLGWRWFWHLGRKTIAAERFPPPDTRTLRPAETLTGAAAVRRGRALCALALVLTMLTGLLAVIFWGLLLDLKPPRH